MSESSPQDNEAVPSELAEIKKAHELANTITLNRLTSKIKQNPAIDLSHLLKQQATTYPQLRDILVQEAHRSATTCTPKEEPTSKDIGTSSPAELHGLLISGDVEITHPLDQRILAHASQRTYCFMSRANGVTLESVWPSLTTAHKLSVQNQLNTLFRILRAAPASQQDGEGEQRIGSFTSTTCKDTRRSQRATTAPIRTEAEFNDFLCHKPGRTVTPWIRMIRSAMGERHGVVRTLGDLQPRNIMVEWT
ncbi:hypothetical protein V500_05147 [Pseudogymnoascus sp. VKM F-4518 (FW-2643)]|nr:hypothetical protein V500_05147 [Pseudogymnoascus sp. VKM F-4518 (FW-2643)]